MHDPWLRTTQSNGVQSPQRQEVFNLRVSDLMMQGERRWDEAKIQHLFSNGVAAAILAVPLPLDEKDDRVSWSEDLHGNYSVRSGYKLAVQEQINWDRSHVMGDWNSLWRAHVPPKVRNLIWRICGSCLPTRERLQQRRVNCLHICELCEDIC